ncbi:DNA replication protein psf2 [Apophysomyces sp. BC1034]|nr:DNA replication protein psf2 [Apophysomyces sp. BC1015]KAG0180664.1 DNA replication protein psf2 [Apophysomyces sp. BC1021]KAG0194863.1 DNA replication protein psf2 [Apophysomyces sp. BC1034]
MALPLTHQAAFTPPEIEYLAEKEPISIIPMHKLPRLEFIQQTVGPFQPPLRTEVPLWIALVMKQNRKCSIICPEWLSVEVLKKRLEEEEAKEEFSALPFHYMETAQMLLESAPDDVPNAEQVRTLLKDLREARQAKARMGLDELDDKWLGMKNLSFMEINEIRPFYTRAFNEMRKLAELKKS